MRTEMRSEVRRVLGRLRDLVEDSDRPRHEVDARLGRAPGYLSQLLAGTIDLKYRHLIEVLSAIDCSPERFFERTYPLPLRRRRPSRPRPGLVAVLRTEREAVAIYGLGIDAVAELRGRLSRCEATLRQILADG